MKHAGSGIALLTGWLVTMLNAGPLNPSVLQAQTTSVDSNAVIMARGLRNRGLHILADRYCQSRLAAESIDPVLQSSLVVEQILARTSQAMEEGAGDEQWEYAKEAGKSFLRGWPNHPRRFLVDLQIAIVDAARARLIRRQIRFRLIPESESQQAIRLLEDCRRELDRLNKAIETEIPSSLQGKNDPAIYSATELRTLSANVNFQVAQSMLEVAELTGTSDRLNRLDALNLVIERLEQVRRQTGEDNGLALRCEILRASALRMQDHPLEAKGILQKIDARTLGSTNRQEYQQEILRLAIEGNSMPDLDATISDIAGRPDNDPETELAVLEFLSTRKSGGQVDLPVMQKWARRIGDRYGRAWERLASQILISSAGGMAATGSGANQGNNATMAADIAARAGEEALASGDVDQAIKAFQTAAEQLLASSRPDESSIRQVMQWKYRTADLLAKKKLYREASDELTELAVRFPLSPLAGPLHLRGCWYSMQAEKSDAEDERGQFRELLGQHLVLWPESETADEARVWRSRLQKDSREWESAFEDSLNVSRSPEQRVAAAILMEEMVRSWRIRDRESLLRASPALFRRTEAWTAELLSGESLESRSAALQLRIAMVESLLAFDSISPEELAESIQGGIDRIQDPTNSVVKRGEVVQLVALLRSGKSAGQLEAIRSRILSGDKAEAEVRLALELADQTGLERLGDREKEWMFEFVRMVMEKESIESGAFRLVAAKLAMAIGEPGVAREWIRELAQNEPNNLQIQLLNARATSLGGSSTSEALGVWRRLAGRLEPKSDYWFEARYEIARLLFESGEVEEVRRMLEFMKAIPPGWSRSALAKQLDELLEKCRGK